MKTSALTAAMWLFFAVTSVEAQIDPSILRPVGYHPSDVAYFNAPYLSNSMALGGEWYAFSGDNFCGDGTLNPCTHIDFTGSTTQFVNGYPKFLGTSVQPTATNNHGPFLRALLFGTNIDNTDIRPPGWPSRETLAYGRYVVTWQGNADVRLKSCSFVPADSTGGVATGSVTNGRRVYICSAAQSQVPESLEIRAISQANPLTDLKVWLPPVDDPATPANENLTGSLEGQFFHPLLLQRIADANWAFIRYMDWGKTNASPQQDWIDRRVPNHIFQAGVINKRTPAPNLPDVQGERETGVAWEHMIALSNATGRDLWINIPHLATADYITKLAQTIRFGSDGVNPFTQPTASPAFAPLNSNLKVYVEYSNEIWSSGFAFAQGNWAQEEARLAGLGTDVAAKARFNARKFCDTWRIFQSVFAGDTARLIRVAAIFTALNEYSQAFLSEIGTYGQTVPTTRPDVLALTTYFGNDVQGFVNEQGFATNEPFDDSYWQSDLFRTHMHLAFEEWKRRILAGDSTAGSGPDATGTSGGFDSSLRTMANTRLPYCSGASTTPCLPLIAYEGGPSIFTDTIDSAGSITDDGVTIFMEAMNRDPRIADVYRIHLDLAKSKGLWTHNPYTDTSTWSRFGQWGHLERLDDAPAASPKYSLMLEHFTLFSTLRHIDAALNSVPSFVTPTTLPTGIAGEPYTTTITTSGGNGARSVVVVGAFLDSGLSITTTADSLTISGTPITSRKNFILARVQDADGDPAWRTFTLQTFGGPGTLVQSNFAGTNPSANLPWLPTFVKANSVNWTGWNKGSGIISQNGDNAIVFSVSGAGSDPGSTLQSAIDDSEFLTATVSPTSGTLNLGGAEIRFSITRIDDHSPRIYTLFASGNAFSGGVNAVDALYTNEVDAFEKTDIEHVVTLPNTPAFNGLSSFEIRIYGSGAKFDGHKTSLTGFKLTGKNAITIHSLSPGSGPTAGGQSVVITGLDLAGTTSVTFGGAAGSITSTTPTSITVTTPAAASGTVDVVVTTSTPGVRTLTGAYRYLASPIIGSIAPNSGSTSGGQSVTINGTNLSNATSVTIGGSPAPITGNTSTSITVTTPAHAAGAVNVVVTTPGGTVTSTNGYTYTLVTLMAPAGVVASAVNTSQIDITWNAVAGATGYEIDRKAAGGDFIQIGTTTTLTTFSDTSRPADTSFLYRVRATNSGGDGPNSASDLATTILFTDRPLVAGTLIKSVHVTELRTAVNAVRALAGLGSFGFTGTAATGTTISALHVTQLRSALDEARPSLGFGTGGYTDSSLTGVPIKAVHLQEIRNRVE